MTSGDPAERQSTPVDGVDVLGALSPSRAGDFMACPLLYRYRTIDKLPEPFSPVAVRGTVIHKVLEDLFDLPASGRTPEQARDMLVPAWESLLEAEPELAEMFADEGAEVAEWLTSCREVLDRYFELEDPRCLEPADRELYVETLLDSKLLLRGIIDRIDVAPDGRIRVVDYKGLAIDTPLPTPTGWTTMGEVQVGDEVFGANGCPTEVTLKSAVHHRPCFRVSFADGSSVVCDNVHLWTVTTSYRREQETVTLDTDALFALHRDTISAGRRKSIWIAAADQLELPDADELPIDPYLLGVWLGDGDTRAGGITVGADDLDDMLVQLKDRWEGDVRLTRESGAFRVHLSKLADRCHYGHDYSLPRTPGHRTRRCARAGEHSGVAPANLPFSTRLRRAGLIGNKHIPARYLRAGHRQRIELVRGLMDSDGWWNKTRHRAGLTTTDDRLAAEFVHLLRTLGIHPQHFVKPYENAVRPNRNMHFVEFTPQGFNPFHLPRKAHPVDGALTDLQLRLGRRRIITTVEPVESVPTQCIAVAAEDSLYLCGEGFIPTHNTGKSPGEFFEGKVLFQMKFYALVIWRIRGVIPSMLQLVYLGNAEILRYVPDERDLLATERKVQAIWEAIRKAELTGDWRPNPSRMCEWCSFQAHCPEFGGEIPPLPMFQLPAPADDPAGDVAADEGLQTIT